MQKMLLGALGLGAVIGSAVPLAVLPGLGRFGPSNLVYFLLFFAGLTVHWGVGAIIVRRANGNLVGWIIASAAALLGASFACYALGLTRIAAGSPGPVAAWLLLGGAALFLPGIFLAMAIFLTFPSGALPGPRWRWPVRVVVAMVAAGVLGVVARPGAIEEGLPDNPAGSWFAGLPAGAPQVLDALGQLSLGVGAALGVLAITIRFRRANREERQQLKLLIVTIVPAAVLLPLGLVGASGGLAANLSRMRSAEGARITDILTVVALTGFNLAVTLAILRYRLYDIDRFISRTISYGAITALLVGVFLLVNLGLQSVLSSVTSGNSLAVAGSTLLAASLFTPVQRRVQRTVDRRFDRSRYDADRTAAGLAGRLRNEIELDSLADDVTDVVGRSLAPAIVSIWVRGRR